MEEEKLLKYAIDYLSKYDSSKNNLINVLKRKIFKSNIDVLVKKNLINSLKKIILKLEKNNLIDDNRYSMSKISLLSRSGKSKIFILNYLIKKGISKYDIQQNIIKFQERNTDWEIDSAKSFVKKKRLLESDLSYEKKLAKMARAGFNYEICKKILN